MAFGQGVMASGLTGDGNMEAIDSSQSTDITLSSNRLQFPLDVNNKHCLVSLYDGNAATVNVFPGAGSIVVLSGKISISANPTTEMGLVTNSVQFGAGGRFAPFRIGTDGRFKIYDTNGVQYATSQSTVSTTAGSPTEFHLTVDTATLSTLWVSLYVNGVEEIALDTGVSAATFTGSNQSHNFGDYSAAGSNFGANMQGQYIVARFSSSSTDSPSLVNYPRLLSLGANVPSADGAATAFNNNTATNVGGSTANWAQVTTNDGVTSYWNDHQTTDPKTAHDQTCKDSVANPFGGSETILYVQAKYDWELGGSGKSGFTPICRIGANTSTAAGPGGTSISFYAGGFGIWATKPGGGSWATSDFSAGNIEIGARSVVAVGANTDPIITNVRGAEGIHYTATLGLANVPRTYQPLYRDKHRKVPQPAPFSVELPKRPPMSLFAAAAVAAGTASTQVQVI